MKRETEHVVDTVIVGLQRVYLEAQELGLHEVAHLASTALLAAEEEAERRIVQNRGPIQNLTQARSDRPIVAGAQAAARPTAGPQVQILEETA